MSGVPTKFLVVSYDVTDDARRSRIAKELEKFGYRVQKSVFECWVTEKEFKVMKEALLALIDPSEDSLRFYFLCGMCRNFIESYGVEVTGPSEDDVVVV